MAARELPQVNTTTLMSRRTMIEAIIGLFERTPVVFLQGGDGFGTTTTAYLFCQEKPDAAFALFIKPAGRISYSADYLRISLAEQYSWLLDGRGLEKDTIDEAEFNQLQLRLRRKATKESPLYFVIDGLHQISTQDWFSLEAIFKDVLPIGWNYFNFLIVGRQEEFEKFIPKIPSQYFFQLKFSISEAHEFLKDLQLSPDDLNAVVSICEGIPGRLASVRRIITGGKSVQQIFESELSHYPEFIRLELAGIESLSDQHKLILAIVTFSNRHMALPELAEVSKSKESDIHFLLDSYSFLQKNSSSREITFISESHRRFAAKSLEKVKTAALEAQIEYLLQNPQSHVALRFLPTYYNQVGQTQELLQLLSPAHFSKLLESTSSIVALKNRAELGLRSAAQLRQATESVFTFSLQRGIFADMAGIAIGQSEINALVATGNSAAAMMLAQSATVREDRFASLCAYAHQLVESRHSIDPDLIKIIRELAENIEFEELGDRAIDMAISLVAVDAGLAMSIVDRVTKASASISEKRTAIARVTLEGAHGANEEQIASMNEAAKNISDEKMQRFSSEISALVSTLSPEAAVHFSQKIPAQRRLLFLCHWASMHKQEANALVVVEYALGLMISDATYVPKMRNLRDLALPLVAGQSTSELVTLINRIDGQRGLIKDSSVSCDSVSLQTILARAEFPFDPNKAMERISDTYSELNAIENVEVKLECYAILLEGVVLADPNGLFKEKYGFREQISSAFRLCLRSTLENSADHFFIIRGALAPLVRADFDLAISICGDLNIRVRRDQAYFEICNVLVSISPTVSTLAQFKEANSLISSSAKKDQSLAVAFRTFSARKYKLDSNSQTQIIGLLNDVSNPDIKCIAYPLLIEILINSDRTEIPPLTEFDELLAIVSSSELAVDCAFSMATAIAAFDVELARSYYEKGCSLKHGSQYLPSDAIQIVANLLCLSSRAFFGMFLLRASVDEELERFYRLIDLIPAVGVKLDLLCELASKALIANRLDVANGIVREKCLPIIEDIKVVNPHYAQYLIKQAFPCFYCTAPNIALHYSKLVDPLEMEPAIVRAIDLLLKRETKNDPRLEKTSEQFAISYSDALAICDLVEMLATDDVIYGAVSDLCASVAAKVNKSKFTANQRADLATRLGKFAASQLPDRFNIKHEGYLILAEASILTLRDDAKKQDWERLIFRGRAVQNSADSGFVLFSLIDVIPTKWESLATPLRGEVVKLFNNLPSPTDKLNRLIQLSENARGAGLSIAKEQLKNAMLLTLTFEDSSRVIHSRRNIIDIAEKISIDFAHELIDLIDNDPARLAAKEAAKQQLSMLRVKKELANSKDSSEIKDENVCHLPAAAWKNVAALMSGRIQPKNPELFIEPLKKSSILPLSVSYPIIAWHTENISRKYGRSDGRAHPISATLTQFIAAAELVIQLVQKIMLRSAERIAAEAERSSPLIGLNNRHEAINFIASWLQKSASSVLLCDPYFGPKDTEFFKLILENCPSADVTILTSKKKLLELNALTAEVFFDEWYGCMEQDPPSTKIIAVALQADAKPPLHDRWLISGKAGLRIGTSFNSIGTGKLSEISELAESQVKEISFYLNRFVSGERIIDGAKVLYHVITL